MPKTPMTSYALFLVHTAKSGQRDALKAVWMRHMAPAIAANPDHLGYVYSFDATSTDTVCAFQIYSSAEAAKAFLEHPSYITYLAESCPLLVHEPKVRVLQPQWVKAFQTIG